MPIPTKNQEIPNFTDSEQLKTSKTKCLLKVYEGKESISLDSRFVNLENPGLRPTLNVIGGLESPAIKHTVQHCS